MFRLKTVKETLEIFPNAINVKGPHGIPFIARAKAGGKEAEAMLEYLKRIAK